MLSSPNCSSSIALKPFTSSGRPNLIHNAHLSLGLERQDFLLRIARRRSAGFARRCALPDGVGIDIGSADDHGAPFAQMGQNESGEEFATQEPLANETEREADRADPQNHRLVD